MDISEHNHIQDGKIFMNVVFEEKKVWVNGRVSSLPTIYWENIVMRLLLTGTSQYPFIYFQSKFGKGSKWMKQSQF